jgi:DNA polymerase-3 subunit delta
MTETHDTIAGSERQRDLYLIYGEEFLVKEEVRKLVAKVLPNDLRVANLITLDGSNLHLGNLSSMLFTPSLFGGDRVIVVEQTGVFAGRADQRKMASKAIESWKSGRRSTSLTALARLLSSSGIDLGRIQEGNDWIGELLGERVPVDDHEIMIAIARALIAEGTTIGGGTDEHALDELIRSRFPEGTVLVFTAEAVDTRKKIFKSLSERGTVIECTVREQKYGSGLEKSFFGKHVRNALKQKGKTISPDALEAMYVRSGKGLRRLHGELDKLVAFLGEREKVTAEDVKNVFADFHEAAFFDLTDALRTADIRKCLPALHENLKIVAHPLQTLGVIAAEVRRLMLARELLFTVLRPSWRPDMSYEVFVPVLAKVREEHPGLLKKSRFRLLSTSDYPLYLLLKVAQKLPLAKLVGIMEVILEADVMLKSTRLGSRSPQSILENVVFTLCAAADSGSPGKGSVKTS